MRVNVFGVPLVSLNASLGIMRLILLEQPEVFWQALQWQAACRRDAGQRPFESSELSCNHYTFAAGSPLISHADWPHTQLPATILVGSDCCCQASLSKSRRSVIVSSRFQDSQAFVPLLAFVEGRTSFWTGPMSSMWGPSSSVLRSGPLCASNQTLDSKPWY